MQEIYSNGKQNTKKDRDTLPWCSVSLDWPFEMVIAEAEVVVSRDANALEWIIVMILQEFKDQPPTLAEAAEELGIKDPVFLTETLKGLVKSGVAERRDPEGNLKFSNCYLTSAGQAFLAQKLISSVPERHGLRLCLDAITGEHVPRPLQNTLEEPQNPIVSIEKLPPKRTNIGLDKARQLAKAQDEPFLTAQSKLTDVKVQNEEGFFTWLTVKASLSIDGNGILRCALDGATERQQQWLNQLDLKHGVFERLFASSIEQTHLQLLPSAKQNAQWRQSIDRLISPSRIIKDGCAIVKSARQEVMANAYWLSLPEVRNEISRASKRGVRCIVFGQRLQKSDSVDSLPNSIEVLQIGESSGTYNEIALLADGSQGLCIDRVELATQHKRNIEVIAVSSLKASRVIQLHRELLKQTVGT